MNRRQAATPASLRDNCSASERTPSTNFLFWSENTQLWVHDCHGAHCTRSFRVDSALRRRKAFSE
jgi:hypothetical protein